MSRIAIVDLEVHYHVGVTDAERAQAQRLLITVELNTDFTAAVRSDRVEKTVNYQNIVDDLLRFGEGRSWKLIERLVTNIADEILNKYKPQSVAVEVKKFIIPQARYVAASVSRSYS
jgi:7,8-dihydroneopterin aldolase/epimerase/oxygenase